jgi:hypothetical protein
VAGPDAFEDLARRVERLEAREEIRQLVARYALALDQRDLDALCGLFPEDVRVGRDGRGRDGRCRATRSGGSPAPRVRVR